MANVSSSNGLEKYPKLRFKGFSESWEHVKLSDFVSRVTRKNSDNQTDIPLTISSKDGLINQNEFFSKQVASKDMSGYYLLQRGEFAYNKSYSVGFDFGSIKRLEKYGHGALSTLYICFALDRFDSDFISWQGFLLQLFPSMKTSPEFCGSKPAIMLKIVDLPLPDGPNKTKKSPLSTKKEIFFSTGILSS